MSLSVYVICRDGENYGNYDMVCWFDTLGAAEAEALRREWADHAEDIARNDESVTYHSPDETEYRKYWVKYVPMG